MCFIKYADSHLRSDRFFSEWYRSARRKHDPAADSPIWNQLPTASFCNEWVDEGGACVDWNMRRCPMWPPQLEALSGTRTRAEQQLLVSPQHQHVGRAWAVCGKVIGSQLLCTDAVVRILLTHRKIVEMVLQEVAGQRAEKILPKQQTFYQLSM